MSANFNKAAIIDFLISKISPQIHIDKEAIDLNVPLAAYGIDSVYAISLCADLEDWLGIPVEPTIAWDYPSIEKMAAFLSQDVLAQA